MASAETNLTTVASSDPFAELAGGGARWRFAPEEQQLPLSPVVWSFPNPYAIRSFELRYETPAVGDGVVWVV